MSQMLLDTCALLWIGNGDKISEPATDALTQGVKEGHAVYVSPFSAWEIGNLVSLGRLNLSLPPDRWFSGAMKHGGIKLAALSPELLVASNFLPSAIHKDPADRIIIATARENGLTIITRDQKILDYAQQGHVNALRC